MEHTVIITGGHLNIEFAKQYLKTLSYDKVFAVDRGLEYVEHLKIKPDYILGDFDSVSQQVLLKYQASQQQYNIDIYPAKKDMTDTELALNKAVKDSDCVTMLGATGSRMDHMLANLDLLLQAITYGCRCFIVNETNRIQMLHSKYKRSCTIQKEEQFGNYLSIIPISEYVNGLSVDGVEYPLKNATIRKGNTLTVSNVITQDMASVLVEDGIVLVIESKDE